MLIRKLEGSNKMLKLANMIVNFLSFLTKPLIRDRGIDKTSSSTYGGFKNEDWQKVGNDMKKGLLLFQKKNK